MRIALMGDIHSNLFALNAVCEDALKRDVDKYIFCGDYISDGPDVGAVINKIKSLPSLAVRGNREQYMLDYRDNLSTDWNCDQYLSLLWIFERISHMNFTWMERLPVSLVFEADGINVLIAHGSPYGLRDAVRPYKNTHILDKIISEHEQRVFVFAHTHKQSFCEYGGRYFINPGSAGMPTDSHGFKYSILDTQNSQTRVESIAVPYDFGEVCRYYSSKGFLKDTGFWGELFLYVLRDNKDYVSSFVSYLYRYSKKAKIPDAAKIPKNIFYKAVENWKAMTLPENKI